MRVINYFRKLFCKHKKLEITFDYPYLPDAYYEKTCRKCGKIFYYDY